MRAKEGMGGTSDSERITLLQRLLEYKYSSHQQMPDHDIISEMMGHMFVPLLSYILIEGPECYLKDCGFRYHFQFHVLLLLGIDSQTGHHEHVASGARPSHARFPYFARLGYPPKASVFERVYQRR